MNLANKYMENKHANLAYELLDELKLDDIIDTTVGEKKAISDQSIINDLKERDGNSWTDEREK